LILLILKKTDAPFPKGQNYLKGLSIFMNVYPIFLAPMIS